MLKPLLLAFSILMTAPLLTQAAELTLLPSVKLQIGDQDRDGHYWDGGHWRDRDWWHKHYQRHENRWEPRHHDERPVARHDRHDGPDVHHR
ncbi:hypothetical protein BN135_2859 [Cronobacter muytjensii 530]